MKRRLRAGGQSDKTRTGKPVRRRNAPKRGRPPSVSAAQETIIAQLTRELNEAREQQTATSDVLKAISRSTFDLQTVLDALVKSAARRCKADMVGLNRPRDGAMHFVANFGLPREFEEIAKRTPFVPGRGTVVGRVLLTGKPVQIADVEADPEYTYTEGQRVAGFRTVLAVPLEHERETSGVIVLIRTKARPFTDKQIELAQNFAAQAVIAIENARLLNELRQSLQQQTATAEVLKTISRSTFHLETVLNTLVESAVRLCDGYDAVILLREGKSLTFGAHHGPIPMDFVKWPLTRNWTAGRAVIDKKPIHIHDLAAAGDEFPDGHAMALRLGHRTILSVPLLREDEAIGSLTVRRSEVRPFTDKQIELVETFADQALIAIENVRLFEAEQQRARELSESLEQQTATSEVLKVISSSPGELEPVFEAMLENAVRICEAKFGSLFRFDGNMFHLAAQVGTPPELAEFQRRRGPFQSGPDTPFLDRVLRTKQVSHTADEAAEAVSGPSAKLGGARSLVCVPMLKDDELIGALIIYRQEVRPFTDKQIELLKNFAAQAVIAIENTRLLNELRESLQQQTATADVLKVISRSTFDLQLVLNTLVESAARLCEAYDATIWEPDGKRLLLLAHHGPIRVESLPLVRGTAAGRAFLDGQTVHITDLQSEAREYPESSENARRWGFHTILCVPLMREGVTIGTIALRRTEAQRPSRSDRSHCFRLSPTKQSLQLKTCGYSRRSSSVRAS